MMKEHLDKIKNILSELTQEQKEELGIELMSIGAELYFTKDGDFGYNNISLKNAINHDTLVGSFADSGGHIHGGIDPMNQYNTQSVINVLRYKYLFKHNENTSSTEVVSWYKDVWKY